MSAILLLAGGVAEWSKAAVLKTVVPQGTVGSNPTSSAIYLAVISLEVCKRQKVLPAVRATTAKSKIVIIVTVDITEIRGTRLYAINAHIAGKHCIK